jgi:hypothetical protein
MNGTLAHLRNDRHRALFAIRRLEEDLAAEHQRLARRLKAFDNELERTELSLEAQRRRQHWGRDPGRRPGWRAPVAAAGGSPGSRRGVMGGGAPAPGPRADGDPSRPASLDGAMPKGRGAAVDLYWIPLGAGGHSVRFNGRVFEAIQAAREHRQRCDLYHAALVIELDADHYTIEVAPAPDADGARRGVVGTGAVGSRHVGWWRLFRYELRCWRGGSIPDLRYAVGGPRRLTTDPARARRVLSLVATVPRPVWGRDELGAGEMWNSNSVVAWLIVSAGLPTVVAGPPPHGRAPGWHAGLEVARRSAADEQPTARHLGADRAAA